jgi:hypothetical protein
MNIQKEESSHPVVSIEHFLAGCSHARHIMMIQFVTLTRRYRRFRESVYHGDSIAIESLYNCFTLIWLATGKHHYFEICPTQIEELYRVILFEILQIVREN